MKAQNIDELITGLESHIKKCETENNRLGFFASLYHTVTCRVKQGMLNNEFEDNGRMEKLDVTFANRYLAALERWEAAATPTESWDVAFKAGKKSSFLLLHHLLLGINAHINLDLGIAAVEVMEQGNLKNIQRDFNDINRIISELTAELVNKINRISPLLSLLGLHATNYNSVFIQFAISSARDGAWCFAEELAEKKDNDYNTCISERDAKIKTLGEGIVHANLLLKVSIWIIRLFEWKKPSKIIKVLFRDEKTYFNVKDTAIVVKSSPDTVAVAKSV